MTAQGAVLVHGSHHAAVCWNPMLAYLKSPLVAVDLPGRGNRPADIATVALADCVDAVIDSADKSGFDRFVLVGHSLGGVTTTETAYRHPDRVAALVYVAAVVPPPGANSASLVLDADLPAGEWPLIDERVAKAAYSNDLTDEQWAENWKGLVPEAACIMNAHLSGYPSGVPITYVSMDDDVAVPAALVAQMIPNLGAGIEHRGLPGGHLPMVSRPSELAAIIDEVVARA